MEEKFDELKIAIVVRKDLDMPIGKFGVQVGHASLAFIRDAFDIGRSIEAVEFNYLKDPTQKKVVLSAKNGQELLKIIRKASEAGLQVHSVNDLGRTVFNGVETLTCIAIGPDYDSKIDPITKRLQLYV